MSDRTIRLHAFASTKGGVGKSSLSVAAAHWIGKQSSRRAVLIDLDLTGSSLADGLGLCAPELVLDEQNQFELDASPQSHLSVELTRERRLRRVLGGPFAALPYVNDALLAREPTNVGKWLWKDPSGSAVGYLPSSSAHGDVVRAVHDLVQMPDDDWRSALIATVVEIVESNPDVTDIVFDLPPGTWGFAHNCLLALRALAMTGHHGVTWLTNAILVLSPDSTALVPGLEYLLKNQDHMSPRLLPVVNRATEPEAAIRRRARACLASAQAKLEPERLLVLVDEMPALSRLFKDPSRVDPGVAAAISSFADKLRLR